MSPQVVVVGSLNLDLRVEVDRRPAPGETVMASALVSSNGGKGGNQAIAAARAGADVRMVGAVGDDSAGLAQLAELDRYGIDTSRIRRSVGRPTGVAVVMLTPDGENSIVVHAGANTLVDPGGPELYADADVVVVQTEIGPGPAERAAAAARAGGARLLVSAAPVVLTATSLYLDADPLVVNEHEARELLAGSSSAGPLELAHDLLERYAARSAVVTLGARGAAVAGSGHAVLVPAVAVDALVDTTGAGDTYAGALAAHLAAGDSLLNAATAAGTAAAQRVREVGARPAVPQAAPRSSLSIPTPQR